MRSAYNAAMITAARVVVFSFVAALVVFCVVQDRLTAAGTREYVTRHRAALEGSGPPVTIDEIMRPAVRHSVQEGLLQSAGVLAVGLTGAIVIARRTPRG
jgi:hypothetical protein